MYAAPKANITCRLDDIYCSSMHSEAAEQLSRRKGDGPYCCRLKHVSNLLMLPTPSANETFYEVLFVFLSLGIIFASN